LGRPAAPNAPSCLGDRVRERRTAADMPRLKSSTADASLVASTGRACERSARYRGRLRSCRRVGPWGG